MSLSVHLRANMATTLIVVLRTALWGRSAVRVGGRNRDGDAVDGRIAAERVVALGIGERVDADASVLFSHAPAGSSEVVTPAVRNADDARHHFV